MACETSCPGHLAGAWNLGARHPGLYVTCVSPAVYSPSPLSSMPVPTAPARQVPPSIPCPSSTGCTAFILHGPSEMFFYPNWPSLGGCWDFEKDLVAPSFRTLTPSKSPLFLPCSFSLLLLPLPASLFCPSCLNRLKPTLLLVVLVNSS